MIRLNKGEEVHYRKLNPEVDFKSSMVSAIAFSLDRVDDYWESVTYYGEGFKDPTWSTIKPEWVYVLVNPSIPGICKIGYTSTSVSQRVKELSKQTSSITPWYSVYEFKCPDGKSLETEIHQALEQIGVRVNSKREGFRIRSDQAAALIESLGKKYIS